MIVESLHIYPLKSARAHDLTRASVDRLGLSGDRRWMVVNRLGNFVTQRGHPRLALVNVEMQEGHAIVTAPGTDPCYIDSTQLSDVAVRVEIWGEWIDALLVRPDLDRWLSRYLDDDVQVVRFDERITRPASLEWAAPGDAVAFADGYAILIVGTASLDALNQQLGTPVPMTRFRPNIVVRTTEPWVEDRWRRVRVGDVELEVVKPCGRCTIINVDQDTALANREPLRTLSTLRTIETRGKNRVVFGQNAVPRGVGEVRIGDPVVVLEG